MTELIKVNENGMVSARETYEFLQLDKTHYARWFKQNITNNEFAELGVDYIAFAISGEGYETQDAWLTPSFAKKLCMKSHSEQGEKARNYFIECEKRLKKQDSYKIEDPIKRAERWIEEQKEKIALQETNEELKVQLNESEQHWTIMKFNTHYDMGWDLKKCQDNGRKASAYCRANNHIIKKCKANDLNYKEVNSYPIIVLEKLFIFG